MASSLMIISAWSTRPKTESLLLITEAQDAGQPVVYLLRLLAHFAHLQQKQTAK